MLSDFDFHIDTKFIFGRKAHTRAGKILSSMGIKSVLIHHDGGDFLYESLLLKNIMDTLSAEGIRIFELGGVVPNPRLDLVYTGIDIARKEDIGLILAIGGGSSIDSAKAIAAGTYYSGDVWDFFTGGAVVEKTLPVGVILTYPASGSESSTVSVINNTAKKEKLLVSSPLLRPKVVFMNPALTFSLPKKLTALGIVDMFSHVCERYFSPEQEIGVIDRMAEGILKTLVRIGPAVLEEPDNYSYRAEIMWIGSMAQNNTVGIGRTHDWATHEIGNELSALYDTPHGITLSVLMGSWMRYVYLRDIPRFSHYAEKVFDIRPDPDNPEKTALNGIESTENFFKSLGMPVSLSGAGIPADNPDKIVKNINFRDVSKSIGGIYKLTAEDVTKILETAR
jgi:alcohol dehydrogenase YqhD (iron-dependent ADH family)